MKFVTYTRFIDINFNLFNFSSIDVTDSLKMT
jgi:hypothetical protein